MFIIFLLFFILFIVWYYKIKSFNLALYFQLLISIILTISWFINFKNRDNDCLIGNKKKVNGVCFKGCIDIYHISHILTYIIVGLLYPNNYLLVLIVSIGWELYEHYMFKYYVKGSGCNDILCLRVEDILLNLIGYYIGSKFNNISVN
jgi:hypothetical protein